MVSEKEIEIIENRITDKISVMFDQKIDIMIGRMFEIFATKDDIKDMKIEFIELRHTVDGLVTAVDGHTAVIEDLRMEYMSMGEQLSRHDRWIHQVAGKTQPTLSFES
jgi:hypothetical protein